MGGAPTTRGARWPFSVVLVALAFACLRAVWIARLPETDLDAYGHFRIAAVLVQHPLRLEAHWVWLPLYHYALAALVLLGGTLASARMLSAVATVLTSLVLYRYIARKSEPTARLAALLFSVASVPSILGVSAQQESWFALLVLVASASLDARRPFRASLALAAACLIRYEAWGAACLLGAWLVLERLIGRKPSAPLWVLALPALAMGGWLTWHRVEEGRWFAFLGELYRFTHAQREGLPHGRLFQALYFPLLLPLALFGPALLLLPRGVRASLSFGWVVPAGIAAFLLVSYLGGGSLGAMRYYGALTPFVLWGVARAAAHHRWRRRLVWASVVVTSLVAMIRLRSEALAAAPQLRAAEATIGHEAARH